MSIWHHLLAPVTCSPTLIGMLAQRLLSLHHGPSTLGQFAQLQSKMDIFSLLILGLGCLVDPSIGTGNTVDMATNGAHTQSHFKTYPLPTKESPALLRAQVGIPQHTFTHGLAHKKDNDANIQHLQDLADDPCIVEADLCARLATLANSSIFACNYNDHAVQPTCGELVAPMKQLSGTCQLLHYYIYGQMDVTATDGSDLDLTLIIGGADL
nr:hypothetical protein [Paecilomyces variotii]